MHSESPATSRIAFWDVDVQPHPVAVIQDETRARINCMALAPGGRYLATAHDDTTVKIFGTLVCCVFVG